MGVLLVDTSLFVLSEERSKFYIHPCPEISSFNNFLSSTVEGRYCKRHDRAPCYTIIQKLLKHGAHCSNIFPFLLHTYLFFTQLHAQL